MRPGPRMIQAFLLLCVGALIVPLVPSLVWVLGSGVLIVIGLACAELLMLRKATLGIERAPVVALSLGEDETVSLTLRPRFERPLNISVRQMWCPLLLAPSSSQSGSCKPGDALKFDFPIRSVMRGAEKIAPPHVATSVWGVVERIQQAGDESEVRVLPNLRAVKRLHGQLNHFIQRGMGSRTSPRFGKGREFDRLRDYVIDDDYRDIAWKASARNRKLIVREYRLDRSQDIVVCLDRGYRMAARTGHISKLDHAVNATVLLSYICNRMEDRVGLLSFGADVEKGIGQGRGAAHLRHITGFATGVAAEYIHTDYLQLAAHIRHRVRQRSLILIMTDLPTSDERGALIRAVSMLTPQHLPLLMILSDPDLLAASKRTPEDHEELCRTLVAKDLINSRQQTMKELRRRGAIVVETTPENTGIDSINSYIDVKRRQLL